MKISKARSALYKSAKVLGDLNSVKTGKVPERLTNRITGKLTSKINHKMSNFARKAIKK